MEQVFNFKWNTQQIDSWGKRSSFPHTLSDLVVYRQASLGEKEKENDGKTASLLNPGSQSSIQPSSILPSIQ